MILTLHKDLFCDVFEMNYELYKEFIDVVNYDYLIIMDKLKHTKDIIDIRFYVHKLLGIISHFSKNELTYICVNLLSIPKKDITIPVSTYKPYVDQILLYDKSLIGL